MTAQTPDFMYLDGEFHALDDWPSLPALGQGVAPRADAEWEEVDKALLSSCCWREYLGTWSIDDGRLYLKEIRGKYRLTDGPLFAQWFSGELTLPQGELLDCKPELDFKLVYERARVLEIEQGRVVADRIEAPEQN
ncbi:hypothetical protein [Ferrimonas futtsuensis]|uniref:hypothetical protein n=1 Tax=Ferrimonas futtsuensis TaxID=364764 RepID=UPI000403B22E|nr:hypothetical protein [Ferrimonas futtsuensis]